MALRIAKNDLFSQLEDLAESKDTKMRVSRRGSTLTAEFIDHETGRNLKRTMNIDDLSRDGTPQSTKKADPEATPASQP